jgi:hypothetical protein
MVTDLFRTPDPDEIEFRIAPRKDRNLRSRCSFQLQLSSPSIKSEEWAYSEVVADYGSKIHSNLLNVRLT